MAENTSPETSELRSSLDADKKRKKTGIAIAAGVAAVAVIVLDAAPLLFEVGGASAVDAGLALDRHWRNARTIASHNPARYRARAIGDQLINDTPITTWWSTGEAQESIVHQ